jgi:uncharacterized protein YkwD
MSRQLLTYPKLFRLTLVILAAGLPVHGVIEGQERRGPNLPEVQEQIVELTNELRRREGLEPLRVDSELNDAAEYFADYMARHDELSHTADGNRPAERAELHGYEYCLILENVGMQHRPAGVRSRELARAFVESWEDSPEHRRSMVDPDVLDLGVGIAQSQETGRYYAVQKFGRHQDERVEFSIMNRTDATVQYTLGDRSFSLPPRITRTHRQCRPPEVTIDAPAELEGETFEPADGESYAVGRDGYGRLTIGMGHSR